MKVIEYDKLINYNSGNTSHFENSRKIREQELTRLLGIGKVIQRFLVCKEDDLQIQEVLSNGIIKVYSAEDHKRITIFAPSPSRLNALFEACGKEIPEDLLIQSEFNAQNGYNNIFA